MTWTSFVMRFLSAKTHDSGHSRACTASQMMSVLLGEGPPILSRLKSSSVSFSGRLNSCRHPSWTGWFVSVASSSYSRDRQDAIPVESTASATTPSTTHASLRDVFMATSLAGRARQR